MQYTDRLTNRTKLESENTYIYTTKHTDVQCVAQLGKYEDLGYSPLELAKLLVEYELQKPKSQWDMDKIEKYQHFIRHFALMK